MLIFLFSGEAQPILVLRKGAGQAWSSEVVDDGVKKEE
jgi:hypothetical protein